jgi:hypothetical protein
VQVFYPLYLTHGSTQAIKIVFPNDRFTLTEFSATVKSKLSILAAKSTFIIEEDTTEIPNVITDNATANKIVNVRVPSEAGESLTLTGKKLVVEKVDKLHLEFSYGVKLSDDRFLNCTVFSEPISFH